MEDKKPLIKTVTQFRKRLLIGLIPLCLFVAGYCMTAGLAAGGWHMSREGEPSYRAPVHHSREFYTGLRWSVMLVGGIMAITSYRWKRRKICGAFGVVAVLFNPIIPLQMSKEAWMDVDLLVFWVFLIGPGYLWPKAEDEDPS